MNTTFNELGLKLENAKKFFGEEKLSEIREIYATLYTTQEYVFYNDEHPYKCQCTSCLSVEDFLSSILNVQNYPFIENGVIGNIYPTSFINFLLSIKEQNKLEEICFYVEEQRFRFLQDFWGNQNEEYENVVKLAYLAAEALEYPKHRLYKDYILLPIAKEINGFDNFGYLFFISKLNDTSDGKIYYFDINISNSRINLVANDFDSLLEKKTYTLNDIFNQAEFISDFLKNHEISFDNNHSNWNLEEISNIVETSKLDVGECYFKLCKMDDDLCYTNIGNSFTFIFNYDNKSYQLICSVTYDDNVNDWNYQKMYEHYFYYDDKNSPIAHFAEIKLRLKMILFATLLQIQDFLAEKRINVLDILTEEHLKELEKSFTLPVEIDYYED